MFDLVRIDLLRLQGMMLMCASTCCKAVFAPHLDHAVVLEVLMIEDMYWNPLATSSSAWSKRRAKNRFTTGGCEYER